MFTTLKRFFGGAVPNPFPIADATSQTQVGATNTLARGQWEGYERNRLRQRATTRLTTNDWALNYGTRENMLAEARVLCQIDPVSRRILRKFANYVVGDLRYKWNTGDDAVNTAYRDYWFSWMDRADASGVHRYTKIGRLILMGMLRDGDIFQSFVPAGPGGRDIQVRLIEGDRVGNYGGGLINIDINANDGSPTVIGGIIRDSSDRPIAYRVNKRGLWGNFMPDQDLPAAQVRHVFDPDRVDAARGVTAFHAVLNDLRDLKETIDAEKSAVKRNSKLALLVKTVTGGLKSGVGGVNLLGNNDDTSSLTNEVNVQEINDGATAYMFPTENMTAHDNPRPGGAWLEYATFMVQRISIGLDLPLGFVWEMLGTGPAVRFKMSDAARTFNGVMDTLDEKAFDPTVARVIANGIERGLLPPHPLWYRFKRQRPPSVSIDAGYDSAARINENKAWMRSSSDAFADLGEDGDEQRVAIATERAKQWKAAHEAAEFFGAPLEYILNPEGLTANKPAEPKDTGDDDGESDKGDKKESDEEED